jgi:cell division protein FtsB
MEPNDWLEFWRELKPEMGWLWLPLGVFIFMIFQLAPTIWRAITLRQSELQELRDELQALKVRHSNLELHVDRMQTARDVREIAEEEARRQIERLSGRL